MVDTPGNTLFLTISRKTILRIHFSLEIYVGWGTPQKLFDFHSRLAHFDPYRAKND
jgi:hypothetical protein